MTRRIAVLLLAILTSSCAVTTADKPGGTLRVERIELIDGSEAVFAELSRSEGITRLRFFEYPDGQQHTTLEMTSQQSRSLSTDVMEMLEQLGYLIPKTNSAIRLTAKGEIATEVSPGGVTFLDEDGDVLCMVSVTNTSQGIAIVEILDAEGTSLFSRKVRESLASNQPVPRPGSADR